MTRDAPQLSVAFAEFAQANQSGASRQPFKGRDIWCILEQVKPTSIVELGSGTTSAVFALWAQRHTARYTAYEHHEGWCKVTARCLESAGLNTAPGPGIVVHPIEPSEGETSVGFCEPVPADVDFLYVDGPPCVLESGTKVPNHDATRMLDRGILPKAIVVDGRTETVDLLLRHSAIDRYVFKPGLAYCLRKGLFLQALAGREHTIFLLK